MLTKKVNKYFRSTTKVTLCLWLDSWFELSPISADPVLYGRQLLQKLVGHQRSLGTRKLGRSLLGFKRHDSGPTGDQGGGWKGERQQSFRCFKLPIILTHNAILRLHGTCHGYVRNISRASGSLSGGLVSMMSTKKESSAGCLNTMRQHYGRTWMWRPGAPIPTVARWMPAKHWEGWTALLAKRTLHPEQFSAKQVKICKICNQSYDDLASQASSVMVTGEYNQKVADAWERIQVNFSSSSRQSPSLNSRQ